MARKPAFHEDFNRKDEVETGSERGFGLVFAVVFAIVGLYPLLKDAGVRPWALAIAGVFLGLALVAPRLLKPLNKLWFRFGMALNAIVTPLVMGLLFYVTVTPIALAMRLAGKDPLRLGFDSAAPSYWIERQPPGPDPQTMRRQF